MKKIRKLGLIGISVLGASLLDSPAQSILLNAGAIDTSQPAKLSAARAVSAAASGRYLHLVQFDGPIQPEWVAQLEQSGCQIVDYVPENAYLVYGGATALKAARTRTSTHLKWAGAYLASDKIHPRARPEAAASRRALLGADDLFAVQLVLDKSANAETVALLTALAKEPLKRNNEFRHYRNIVVRLDPAEVAALAARPDVISIAPYALPKKLDERQGMISAGQLAGNGPTGPGYLAWLAAKGFTQAQFTASGLVVDVCDSGLDNGTSTPNHFGLYTSGNTGLASRVVYARLEGTPNSGSTLQGCDGHGTLNGHVIGGYNDRTAGFPHQDSAGFRYGLGLAPFVKLGSSVIFDSSDFTSPDYEDMISRAYRDGARISSDSWGADTAGDYDADAQAYDALVRDAQPSGSAVPVAGNQQITIVFAAGNAGSGAGTVGSPGTAKNVITVGAAENVHPHATTNGGNNASGNDGCTTPDTEANSANDIASFSSRGPCSDGRKKPEIVAPGTHVTGGVAQQTRTMAGNGNDIACFEGTGVCALPGGGTVGSTNNFFPLGQQWYSTSSGTSHSTPAVAGGAALAYQYFLNQGWNAPSPAMLKAFLMNSARYMTGVDANDTLWSNNQGMGMMNLGTAFDGAPCILRDQLAGDLFTATGQSRTFSGTVADTNKPVLITLIWTDAPGSTTGNAYKNNLDLVVVAGGATYRGNVFSGAYSTSGGMADAKNNAESIFLRAGVAGLVQVTVSAANVNSDGVPNYGGSLDQDFALVMRGLQEATPLPAPAAIWASATNATDFTAAWSPVLNATGYQLDVATNSAFSGGGGGAPLIDEDFVDFSDWTDGGTAADTDPTHHGADSPCRGLGAGDTLTTPAVNNPTQLTFYVDASAKGDNMITTNYYSLDGGTSWSPLGTFTSTTAGATITQALTAAPNLSGASNVRFRFVSSYNTWYLDDVKVTGGSPAVSSYVPGYSNRTVSGTSQSVTGLTAGATYYFRARAVSNAISGADSSVTNVTTVSGESAPVFAANPGPIAATVGVPAAFTVSAAGNPLPALGLQSNTASSGYSFMPNTGQLTYTPPQADIGSRTFTFTASNSVGVATQTVSVTVAAVIVPTVSFGADRVVGEEGGSAVSLPVVLSSAAAATVQVAIAGTALNGSDFTCSTTLVFTAASATSNLIFTIVDDAAAEGPETARLTLNPVSGATAGTTTQAALVVRDNDAFSILAANLTSGTTTVNDVTTYDEAGGRILAALQPDIVLIQEWVLKPGTTNRTFVDEYFGTNYYFYVEPQGGYYPAPNGIISRWPIVASNEWNSPYSSDTRDFPWAYIDLPGPRDLHAVSVHLKATGDAPADDLAIRVEQAQALTNYVAQSGWSANDYLVIGGDLNTTGRTESTVAILANVVSDARKPTDQAGNVNSTNTNSGRNKPYDYVLPNPLLDARTTNFTCYGYTFANGMVFDTRLTWSSGLPPPALAADSNAENMQHMAVMKVFAFEPEEMPPAAPASVWASATNAASFMAAWSSVANATSYRLDVATSASFSGGGGGAADLFISEYVEGAGSEKYVEIFNGTGASVELSNYALLLYANGATTPGNSNALSGTLANGAVAVYRNSSATNPVGSTLAAVNFNGDDAVALYKVSPGGYVDVFGRIGEDPGSAWTSGSFSTVDKTLVRKSTVTAGVAGNPASGFPTLATEWDQYAAGTESYLNSHVFSGGSASTYVPGYSNLTVGGTSQLVTGLTAGVTYYFRVCAVNGSGTGTYSTVTNVATLTKADQTINFPAIAAQITTNTVALAATASSGLAVSYAVASGPATLAGATLSFTNAGTVGVVASQSGNATWNPAPNVTNTFSVTKATATVTLGSLGQAYNGTARAATATTVPAGLTVGLTYNGSIAAPTNAGSYTVTGTVSSLMYQGSTNGTLTVSKAALTVTADAKSKPFGAANPPLTFQYSGFAAGETAAVLAAAPTAATTVNVATLPGVYAGAITVSGGSAANYSFAYVPADFTVTEAIASLAAGSNDVQVSFGPVTNGTYELLYRASLTNGAWTAVTSLVVSAGASSATLTHNGGGANELGYYRVNGLAGESVQTFGFVKAAKPGNAKLSMVGIPFATSNQTLNSLMDPLQFSGHHVSPGSADQIMVWDAGTQGYLNLALYDVRAYGAQYAYLTGWKAYTNFASGAPYVNPILPAGAAVWIRGATADDRKVAIAGEVVAAGAVTNEIAHGLQMVANPFSETVGLSNLNIAAHATGHYLSPGAADQIMVWDAGTQGYLNLALYDVASYYGSQYADLTGWKAYTNFTSQAPYVSPVFPPGQGFWYRAASNDFEWVETNKYLGALQ